MLIGEAPGRDEDRIGKPFVGRAGQLLDKMLARIGLDRKTNAYITNVINWRPPDNRDPSPEEAAACLPFLRRHIELANPQVIILLGAVAARHVVGVSDGIMKLRGRWMEYRVGDRMVPLMPTLHPAYLLRQPAHKKLAWRDLQSVRGQDCRTLAGTGDASLTSAACFEGLEKISHTLALLGLLLATTAAVAQPAVSPQPAAGHHWCRAAAAPARAADSQPR